MTTSNNIPLSLYIHLPWCVRKCPYCDFNSHVSATAIPQQLYIRRLLADFAEMQPRLQQRPIQTIFFGGGTPSLFSADVLAKLLNTLQVSYPFARDLEITLEANPGTIEHDDFKAYRATGINRISLGLQSFQNEKLQALGRIHNAAHSYAAIEELLAAGFTNFNLDLMHGLPQQTVADSMFDLEQALQFKPTHLSWYQLTIEPNTYFDRYPPHLPNENTLSEIEDQGLALLAQHGYARYEISAYAKAGKQCRHNLNYWQFGDYVGIGAGAHSKLSEINKHGLVVTRLVKTKNPKAYLDPTQAIIMEEKTVTAAALRFEFMLNALRLMQPISYQLFSERTQLASAQLLPALTQAATRGLVVLNDYDFMVTAQGSRFVDDIVALFLNL